MKIVPPNNSRITVDHSDNDPILTISHGSGGVSRIVISLFMIFWLGGWATGWVSAAHEIISGKSGSDLFLIFWICSWTAGGIFAFWFLYRLLRPSISETLSLEKKQIKYDSGIKPYKMSFGFSGMGEYWKQMFPKRTIIAIPTNNLSSLKLREHSNGNRLTVDVGPERLELATSATEIEREWLYTILNKKYR